MRVVSLMALLLLTLTIPHASFAGLSVKKPITEEYSVVRRCETKSGENVIRLASYFKPDPYKNVGRDKKGRLPTIYIGYAVLTKSTSSKSFVYIFEDFLVGYVRNGYTIVENGEVTSLSDLPYYEVTWERFLRELKEIFSETEFESIVKLLKECVANHTYIGIANAIPIIFLVPYLSCLKVFLNKEPMNGSSANYS